MSNLTGTEIIEVLQKLGEMEWGKCNIINGVEKNLYYPPIIVWRFKVRDFNLELLILKAVESFRGNVDWEITKPGRNWVISPQKVREFQEQHNFRIYVQALFAISEQYPEFCKQANEDIPALAGKIREMTSIQ